MTTINIQGLTSNISNDWVISGNDILSNLIKLYMRDIIITNLSDTMQRLVKVMLVDFPKMTYNIDIEKSDETLLSEGVTIY